jgi:hypothetical protein
MNNLDIDIDSDTDTTTETDSEYFSEYDVDDDYDEQDNSIFYEPEENSETRFNIVLCELYNQSLEIESEKSIDIYLVHYRFKKLNIHLIETLRNQYEDTYAFIGPEIAECIYLETQECVAILKTFWIKLIQRTWKNIFKKRNDTIKKRCHPNSLRIREITGKWPKECLYYPELKGMLYSLNNKI